MWPIYLFIAVHAAVLATSDATSVRAGAPAYNDMAAVIIRDQRIARTNLAPRALAEAVTISPRKPRSSAMKTGQTLAGAAKTGVRTSTTRSSTETLADTIKGPGKTSKNTAKSRGDISCTGKLQRRGTCLSRSSIRDDTPGDAQTSKFLVHLERDSPRKPYLNNNGPKARLQVSKNSLVGAHFSDNTADWAHFGREGRIYVSDKDEFRLSLNNLSPDGKIGAMVTGGEIRANTNANTAKVTTVMQSRGPSGYKSSQSMGGKHTLTNVLGTNWVHHGGQQSMRVSVNDEHKDPTVPRGMPVSMQIQLTGPGKAGMYAIRKPQSGPSARSSNFDPGVVDAPLQGGSGTGDDPFKWPGSGLINGL